MPAPYSLDLRKRAMRLIEKGTSTERISKLLEISIPTLELWIKHKKNRGTIEAKTGYQKGHSHKIINEEEFLSEIQKNPSITLEDLGKKFGCSRAAAHRFAQKIGLTHKKKLLGIKKDRKKLVKNTKKK